MKLHATTAALWLVSTGLALAAVDPEALVNDLQAQGFTRIEVKTGPGQVKVEAVRGTEKVERVYDMATGAVLKTETKAVGPGDDLGPGVSFDSRDDDFERGTDGLRDRSDDSDGRADDRRSDGHDDRDRADDRGGVRDGDRDDDRGDDRGDDRSGEDD